MLSPEMENSLDLTTLTVRIFFLYSAGISLAATCVHCLTELVNVSSKQRGGGGKTERKTLGTILITIVWMWLDVNLGLFSMGNSGYAVRQG